MTPLQFIGIERLPWWNVVLGLVWALLAVFWWSHGNPAELVFCTACSAFNFGRANG